MNYAKMKKEEIVWIGSHKCQKHGVFYSEHPNCYAIEQPDKTKIAFFDIECSNLAPEFGIVISWAFKPLGKPPVSRIITKKEVLGKDLDRPLLIECFKEMRKYDKIIGYYSTKFDVPFLRTRATMLKLDFPLYGDIKHQDVYYAVKFKFKLNRNRLDSACRSLLGNTTKTYLSGYKWIRALQGDKDALLYVEDHNRKDVEELERLYLVVDPFARPISKSV